MAGEVVEVVVAGLGVSGNGEATAMLVDGQIGRVLDAGLELPEGPGCFRVELQYAAWTRFQYSCSFLDWGASPGSEHL